MHKHPLQYVLAQLGTDYSGDQPKSIFENSWISTLEIKIETTRKLHDQQFNSGDEPENLK
jgi:hypothetical protein